MARAGTLWLSLTVFFIFKTNAGLPEVHLNNEAAFADPQGRLLLFHGFNSVYKQPPYFNAKDVSDTRLNFFQQWGFNVVRLGVLWHPTFPLGPGDLNDTYLKAIEWQVDRFANAGIYVILDMHQDSLSTMFGSYDAVPLWLLKSFPKPPGIFKYPWPRRKLPSGDWEGYTTYACQMAFQHIYNNQTNAWEHWGNFWVQVANRFKNRSNVLGYELMNEPFAGNIYTNPLRGIPGYAGKHNLAPVYDYLVRRIRSVDKQKFIFFEGVTWSVLATSKHDGLAGPGFECVPGGSADPQEFRKSVFSYHYYCPLIELANGSLNFSPYTRLICDDIIMPRMFSSVKGIARGLKSGRFLTEFGICAPDGNPDSINTIECNAVMNAADAQLQSWTYWDARFFDEKGNPVIDLYSESMGNSPTSRNSFQLKCFPSAKKLPDTSLKMGCDTSPSDLFGNQATVLNAPGSTQIISRSIEDSAQSSALCLNLGAVDVKKTMSRNSLQKISLAVAYLRRGLIKNSGHQSSSNGLSPNPLDVPTPIIKAESPSIQSAKRFAVEVHPSDNDHKQLDSIHSGRPIVHPYARPKTLTIRAYSANDVSPKPSSWSFDYTSPNAEGRGSEFLKLSVPMTDTSADLQTGNVIGTPKCLQSIPDGTCSLRNRCAPGSTSKAQPRRQPLSKLTTSPSLDSATTTTMSCTLLHHPSPTKVFPFLPDGTAYLLSDEQHRAVDQSLRSTKLLLNSLKRLLIENAEHPHSFAEQVENRTLIHSPVHGNCIHTSPALDTFEVESPSSKNTFGLSLPFAAAKKPTNLDDAMLEIRRLKEENSRLQEELAKAERYIHLFLQKQFGDNNLTL